MLARSAVTGPSPQGKQRRRQARPPSPGSPVAAASHSASDGRRRPDQRQYASASYQQTWLTGRCGSSGTQRSKSLRSQPDGPRRQYTGCSAPAEVRHAQPSSPHRSRRVYPPSSAKAANSPWVTAARAIAYGASSTGCTHFSLSCTNTPPRSAPSGNRPPGTCASPGSGPASGGAATSIPVSEGAG